MLRMLHLTFFDNLKRNKNHKLTKLLIVCNQVSRIVKAALQGSEYLPFTMGLGHLKCIAVQLFLLRWTGCQSCSSVDTCTHLPRRAFTICLHWHMSRSILVELRTAQFWSKRPWSERIASSVTINSVSLPESTHYMCGQINRVGQFWETVKLLILTQNKVFETPLSECN